MKKFHFQSPGYLAKRQSNSQRHLLPPHPDAQLTWGSACFDLWRLGLAHSVLPEQLYWLQYEKFTAAAAKIRLKKVFRVDTDRRVILSS